MHRQIRLKAGRDPFKIVTRGRYPYLIPDLIFYVVGSRLLKAKKRVQVSLGLHGVSSIEEQLFYTEKVRGASPLRRTRDSFSGRMAVFQTARVGSIPASRTRISPSGKARIL